MAEESEEQSQKTEEPTQRRLQEAVKKGQVPQSREVYNLLILIAFSFAILWFLPLTGQKLMAALNKFIINPHAIEVTENSLPLLIAETLSTVAIALIPIILAALAAAFLGGTIQHGLLFSFEPIVPKLEKISPIKGLKRLFSLRSLTEFLKGILKISLVGLVAFLAVWPERDALDAIISFDLIAILMLLDTFAMRIMIGVIAFMIVIAIADFLYQKFEYTKNLRMSRRDIKEELKQTEGDPHIKARLRQIRSERLRKRMMAAVPEADVVITNPTHFAVALKYEQRSMAAPLLVAKGMDFIALKMREIAEESDIPIVENPPLARGLYDAVEIDEEIPLEYYQAVAEVISYVYRLKGNKAA